MHSTRLLLCIVALWLISATATLASQSSLPVVDIDDKIIIEEVKRGVDLRESNFVKHICLVQYKNNNDNKSVNQILLALPKEFPSDKADNLALVEVKDSSLVTDFPIKKCTVKDSTLASKADFFVVDLTNSPIKPGASLKLRVKYVFTGPDVMKAYPAEIEQDEDQVLLYRGNLFFYAPYSSLSQLTDVSLASKQKQAYTNVQGQTRAKDASIIYGPFAETAAFTSEEMEIQAVNNKPFIVAPSVHRHVEVSHWGLSASVKEKYLIKHGGAKVKSFSMLDFIKGSGQKAPSHFRRLLARVPRLAHDLYFRDEIGNISTSQILNVQGSALEVMLMTRYPMFGGWKNDFTFGYDMPLDGYLSVSQSDSSYHVLNITFGPAIPPAVVDDYTLTIALPEGAQVEDIKTNFGLDSADYGHFSRQATYLDVQGRTLVTLRKFKVTPDHNVRFQIFYRYRQALLLQQPVLLMTGLFAVLMMVVLLQRIDLSVGGKDGSSGDVLIGLVDKATAVQEKRSNVFTAAEQKLGNLKLADTKQYAEEDKKFRQQLKDIGQEIENIVSELNKLDSQVHPQAKWFSGKLSALEKLEAQRLAKFSEVISALGDAKQQDKAEKAYFQALESITAAVHEITEESL